MEKLTESFAFLRYVPLCLAAFMWVYYLLTCSEHNKYSFKVALMLSVIGFFWLFYFK
ncbi:TPA: hypothetical protein QH403_004795 [Escherichia coli]|nr:hypothetical protein [Escherichia coli]HDS4527175.1 hypothetical protein [Escherichia coli]